MSLKYEEQTVTERRMVGAVCDHCGGEWGTNQAGNLDGGVEVVVHGWYGGTIDPVLAGPPSLILCDGCASEFIDEWLPAYGLVSEEDQ